MALDREHEFGYLMNAQLVNADTVSQPYNTFSMNGLSLQMRWDGDLVAEFQLQFTNVHNPSENDWFTSSEEFPAAQTMGDGSFNVFENFSFIRAKWVRVVVDVTSGSGLLSIISHNTKV